MGWGLIPLKDAVTGKTACFIHWCFAESAHAERFRQRFEGDRNRIGEVMRQTMAGSRLVGVTGRYRAFETLAPHAAATGSDHARPLSQDR